MEILTQEVIFFQQTQEKGSTKLLYTTVFGRGIVDGDILLRSFFSK